MTCKFAKHYSREEARQLLPEVRTWLKQITKARQDLRHYDERFAVKLAEGRDLGGEPIHRWVSTLADLQKLLLEFGRRQIMIKDLDRGLVDFPALLKGKEVFLCWEEGEEDIEFWHDLDAGYAGREKL